MPALDQASAERSNPPLRPDDPFDDDLLTDEPVLTTRRALVRLALVATETASRFERDHVDSDAMTWMLTPRGLFDGLSAIDACLARDAFLKAVLLHGLSLDLDAETADIDKIIMGV